MLLLQIIILMVFIFGGLLFVLHHILTKNISTATTHLDQLNSDYQRREEDIKKRQAEAENHYEEMIAKAKDEADKTKQEADAMVKAQKDKVLEEARVTSEQIIQKAEKTKQMLTNELRQEMEAKITSRIREVIQSVFPKHIQQELHELWLADLLDSSLSHLSQQNIPQDTAEVKVVSAFALTASQRQALLKKFKEQLGRDFSFKEEVDPALVGGVLLTMGSLVLDGTIANKITQKIGEHV
ncbi:MAG: F0F1 ATP synthase subunit delta [Candidatus Omnitrophica bacterium]|nr:F0F1 ATP synthase subunit delta [Candidatus Omnitrophota bacterium]